ncbi:U4/U6.U5 small nuclear ribonucleoprotein [Podila epigama]|nr:U4/U6.U5 small nuclear ribonucleoprotein [Podila epigama]
MPYSQSPERNQEFRGPPKDWDAPEEQEEGEISYSGRRGGGGGGGGGARESRRDMRDRSRDRSRDRGGRRFDDRNRGDRDRDPVVEELQDPDRLIAVGDRDPEVHEEDDVNDGDYRRRRGDSKSDDEDSDRHSGKDERSKTKDEDIPMEPEKPLEEMTPEEQEARMMALMGFGGFDSTKGKKVAGADVSGADIKQQRTYRQYMNRRGGFNR